MTPKKYKRNKNETKIEFVTRIVVSENKPMTANDVVASIDRRSMKSVKPHNIHANLSDAVSKYDTLCKKRMENEQGKMRVHYYPCSMDVEGEDIPVPAYTKEGGNTFTNEPADEEDETPAPVKVAEKVLADLGASEPKAHIGTKDSRDPVRRRVMIDGGWVDMVDDAPKNFTPNALRSIADGVNMTDEALVRLLVGALKNRAVNFNQQTQTLAYFIKEFMLDNYGLSGHRRQ